MADFMSDAVVIKADALERAVADIFVAAKCARDEAERIARCLVSANLTGHDSHGVIRTPRYVQWLQEGKVRAGQTLTIVRDAPTHVVVDGNYGFGQTIAPLAVDLGIARAREHGLSVVGLRNSGHVGRVGDWGERAAADGLVSLHFVNVAGGELVAPFGGTSRRFSTNPICITVPAGRTSGAGFRDLAGRRGEGPGGEQRRQAGAARFTDRAGRAAVHRSGHAVRADRGDACARRRARG